MRNLCIYALQTKDSKVLSNFVFSYEDVDACKFILNELQHVVNFQEVKDTIFSSLNEEEKEKFTDDKIRSMISQSLSFIHNSNFVKVGFIKVDNEIEPLVNDFNTLIDLSDFKIKEDNKNESNDSK